MSGPGPVCVELPPQYFHPRINKKINNSGMKKSRDTLPCSPNKFRLPSLEQKWKIPLNPSNSFHTVPNHSCDHATSISFCTSLWTITSTKETSQMQHSAIINVRAVATNTRHDHTAVPVMSWCLTLGWLGDHAETLFPHHHSCLSKQTILASCTNASFHIVSPLCKSKCGNRIQLIL